MHNGFERRRPLPGRRPATGPVPHRRPAGEEPPIRKTLSTMLLNVLPALGTYYLLRLLHVGELPALLASTGVGALRVLYVIIKDRELDGIAACTLLVLILSVIPSLLTGDPRLLLAAQSIPTAVIALVLLATCLTPRPAAYTMAERMHPEAELAAWQARYTTQPAFRRIYQVVTLVWATALFLESILCVILVYLLPIDVMTILSTILIIATILLTIRWATWYGDRRAKALTPSAP